MARVAADRVAIAEYRVPRSGPAAPWFRVARDFEGRLRGAGLEPKRSDDVGPYRIWLRAARRAAAQTSGGRGG